MFFLKTETDYITLNFQSSCPSIGILGMHCYIQQHTHTHTCIIHIYVILFSVCMCGHPRHQVSVFTVWVLRIKASIFTHSAISPVPILFSPTFFKFYFMCMDIFPELVSYACLMPTEVRSIGSPRIRIRGGCEAPCKWELKLHPLQEQFLLSHLIWDPKENDLLKYVWWKIWKLYSTGKQKSSF